MSGQDEGTREVSGGLSIGAHCPPPTETRLSTAALTTVSGIATASTDERMYGEIIAERSESSVYDVDIYIKKVVCKQKLRGAGAENPEDIK